MALQNSTLKQLRDLTFALIGREYTDTSASYGRINSLWNYAAQKAHNSTNYWERYLVIGDERKVLDGHRVPQGETNKNDIDTFLRIYPDDPNKTRGGEYKFVVNSNGAILTSDCSNFSSDLYENPNSVSYYEQPSSADDPTVFVTYKKKLDVNLASDDADTTEIPSEFLPYMAHLTAYTWQRSVEQNASDTNFTLSLGLVNSILEDELAKISDQNIANSYIIKNMRTNYNQTII
jgi:hypothetical protein